jgi:hypothetical protein
MMRSVVVSITCLLGSNPAKTGLSVPRCPVAPDQDDPRTPLNLRLLAIGVCAELLTRAGAQELGEGVTGRDMPHSLRAHHPPQGGNKAAP